MSGVAIQWAAALLLLVVLWKAFRFAMMMRATRVLREEARLLAEKSGRRVIAEVPTPSGELELFTADAGAFYWGEHAVRKADLVGCRLLLNGGVMASAVRAGVALPEAGAPADYEGRERWEVRLYLAAAEPFDIPCGILREGVSRDAARAVFAAVQSSFSA
jgi:hypothetical protein